MSVMKNNPLYADVLEDFALKNVKQEKGYCKVPATLWNGMIHPILGYTVKEISGIRENRMPFVMKNISRYSPI
mgnify:CR=1 FL=1